MQELANMLYKDAVSVFRTIIGVNVHKMPIAEINKNRLNWLKTQQEGGGYKNENQVKLINAAYDTLKKDYDPYYTPPPEDKPPTDKTVETPYIRMTLHDKGDLQGVVLQGTYANKEMADLSRSQLIDLLNEVQEHGDEGGVKLVTAWLDEFHKGWRRTVGNLCIFWAWKGPFTGAISEMEKRFSLLFSNFPDIDKSPAVNLIAATGFILEEFVTKNHISRNEISEVFVGKIGSHILSRIVGEGRILQPPYRHYPVENVEEHPTNIILLLYGLGSSD